MARPSNTEARRDEIVEAMLGVVAEHGYVGASTKQIASAAGLAPGLVHYHFENKQAILVALFERLVREVDSRFAELQRQAPDTPEARLDAFIDAHVALGAGANERAVAAWVAIGAEAARNDEVGALFAGVIKARLAILRGLFRDVLAARGAETREARAMAAATLAAIEGAYRLSAAAPDAMPRGFAAPSVRRMVQGLLASADHGGSA